jgi:hypothetical protein
MYNKRNPTAGILPLPTRRDTVGGGGSAFCSRMLIPDARRAPDYPAQKPQ